MLLRQFSYNNIGDNGASSSAQAERWPQPMWQDPSKKKVVSSYSGGGKSDAKKKVPSPPQTPLNRNQVSNEATQRNVQLRDINPSDASYDHVVRIANRYLNPSYKVFHGMATSRCEIERVQQLVCTEARKEFERVKSSRPTGSNGSGGNDTSVKSGSSSGAVVSKVLTLFDKEHLLKRGVLGAQDLAPGPIGDAVHFGNVFEESMLGNGQQASSPSSSGGSDHPEELLLCEVAAGRICLNPGSGLIQQLADASSNSQNSDAAVQHTLHGAGFDSITTQFLGAPHLTVCDLARVLPTHLISYRRIQTSQSTQQSCRNHVQGENGPGKELQASSPSSASATEKKQSSMEKKQAALNKERDEILEGSKRATALVRQQFRDLEEALRTRRDYLLALVRKEEEAALSSVSRREKAVASRGSSPHGKWGVLGSDDDEQDEICGPIYNTTSRAFSNVSLDTSRLMGMIDHQRVEGLTTVTEQQHNSIGRARSANVSIGAGGGRTPHGASSVVCTPTKRDSLGSLTSDGTNSATTKQPTTTSTLKPPRPTPMSVGTLAGTSDLQRQQKVSSTSTVACVSQGSPARPQTSPMLSSPFKANGQRPSAAQTNKSRAVGGSGALQAPTAARKLAAVASSGRTNSVASSSSNPTSTPIKQSTTTVSNPTVSGSGAKVAGDIRRSRLESRGGPSRGQSQDSRGNRWQ